MVKFGFGDYITDFSNWSKHHKTLGLHVKRVYNDGKQILPNDEKLKDLVLKNENLLKSKHVWLFDRKTFKEKEAVDYYLPLKNLEYQETDIDYYSVGAANTRQTTHIRLTFLLEYDKFILDYSFKSEGSFAKSFYDLIDSMDFVEDIIDDVLEQGKPIEEVGIVKGKEEDFKIIIVTPVGEIMDIEIEKRELLNSLVGVEIYKFEKEIVD